MDEPNKVNIKPVELFHTPASKEELEQWVASHKDPHVTTAFMMTWNWFAANFDMTRKEKG